MSEEYLVYIATSPSNKIYVGVTNNFKRRIKEHLSSPYPFGKALRKYGKSNFKYEFILCESKDKALKIEEHLVGLDEVKSKEYYNISPGGRPDIQLGLQNPMKNPEVLKNHPALFTSENNPMKDPYIVEKNKKSQEKYKKFLTINNILYKGINETARLFGMSPQKLRYRCKSKKFQNYMLV